MAAEAQIAYFALVTPRGPGGVSVFWLWGPEAGLRLLDLCLRDGPWGRNALRHGFLRRPNSDEPVDEVLLARPKTGRRVLSGHGGLASIRALTRLLAGDLRYREANETEKAQISRDFFGGCGDAKPERGAEASESLLPAAATETQAAALLLAREGCLTQAEAKAWLRPRRVVLAGPYNAGKSSLFNRLLGRPRSLAADWAGTTLDPVSETTELAGLMVEWVDLPGLPATAGGRSRRAGGDEGVWNAAWNLALEHIATADAVLAVIDARGGGWTPEEHACLSEALLRPSTPPMVLWAATRADAAGACVDSGEYRPAIHIADSAETGISELKRALSERLAPGR